MLITQKSLTPVLAVRLKARWRDTVGRNVGRFHAGKHTAPCRVIEGRRSDSNRDRGSGDPEQRALLVPGDGEAGPVAVGTVKKSTDTKHPTWFLRNVRHV